jgi:RNA polymerase sigma-70 factor, ECF subfamily
MTSDQNLIEKIQAQDPASFEVLYERYAAGLRAHLGRIVRDDAAADDLLQEVFLRVWTHAVQWQGQGAVKAWLYTIATHQAFNFLRTCRRRPQQPLEVSDFWSVISLDEEGSRLPGWLVDNLTLGPEAAVELAEQSQAMQRMVDELPEEKKQVLRLVHELEMSIRDTAGELGVSEGTVKSRLHYARQKLRNELDSYKDSGE